MIFDNLTITGLVVVVAIISTLIMTCITQRAEQE